VVEAGRHAVRRGQGGAEAGAFFEEGFNVLFADGSVRHLPKTIKAEKLKALITRNGGEPVGPD